MEEESSRKDMIIAWTLIWVVVLSIPTFIVLYYLQESKITDKLEECSFYPIRMPTQTTMYYNFSYQGKKYENGTSVGAGELGYSYSRSSAMSTRYWVRIYCKDFAVKRICWEAKVPDTLQYIPPKGWEEIPYGLDVKPRYW